MADISKITLPSGNTYDIKDAVARQAIAGGIGFVIVWTQTDWASSTAPDSAKLATIPKDVVVHYNSGANTATGTLVASESTIGNFYLIYSTTQVGSKDVYNEYVTVSSGGYFWEKIGDTEVDLTGVVTNVSLSKQTDVVLGEGTTFSNASSSVSFGAHTTDNALGEDTTFALTSGTVTVTPTTTNIKATASGGGTAWNSKDSKTVVTGYTIGSSNKDTFVKSVSAETNKKLDTTTITGTNGTESVSKVTKTASKLVTTSVPNVTAVGNASTWSFSMGSGDAAETLIISGANSTAPTLGTAITAATGSVDANGTGSDIVTAVTISDKTVAKAASSATTVATGTTSANGTGDAVVTGVTIGASADAITSLPDPSTATVIGSSSTFTNTQPTVALATGATAGTGVISVATGITSASVGTAITVGTNDKVAAITALGAGTAAAQTITVGTNDKVTALTNATDVSVTKGSNSGE